jgi:isopentenyldiphosphate isomerase
MNEEAIQQDLEEIDRRLDKANRLTPPPYTQLPTYHPEYFPIFDIAGCVLKSKGLIINWRAHLAGIRHKTVNAIFITERGELILQRRASNTIIFPSRYSLSVGGHVSHDTPDANCDIDPLDKLMAETKEELGLTIERARFVPLGDPQRGISNFLHAWVYQHDEIKAMVTVFDPSAKHIGLSLDTGAKASLSDHLAADVKEIVRRETLGSIPEETMRQHHLSLFTRNVELCHFYTVTVRDAEIAKIHFADGEVAGFRRVDFDGLIREARSLDTTTDSLYTLFYDRDDIAKELKERIQMIRN